jgi:hypothetical protein
LAPAVLAAPLVDAATVLIRLGRVAFGSGGLESRFSSWIDEATLLRNAALVLQRGRFEALRRHFRSLIDAPQAKALLLALKRTDAIDWRDGQQHGELTLRVGEKVQAALDDVEPVIAVVEGLGSESFDRARTMLSEYYLTRLHQRSRSGPEGRSFNERLAESSERRRHMYVVGS